VGYQFLKIKCNIPTIEFKKEISLKGINIFKFFVTKKDILEMNLE